MKTIISILLWLTLGGPSIQAAEFNAKEFAHSYFGAWTASQSPQATKEDIEHYLSFLTEDVGHQHLPYDPDDNRSTEGKNNMRKGMNHYLGVHTEYAGTLVSITLGYDVVVIQYDTVATGVHPQTKEVIVQKYQTLEVLEIEKDKVSVIRKYSE